MKTVEKLGYIPFGGNSGTSIAANVAAIAWSNADDEFSLESMKSAGDDVSDNDLAPGGMEDIDGIIDIAAAIGGKTPDIDDDVSAAIALAAFAARLRRQTKYTHTQVISWYWVIAMRV